jgi:hypothetical protein
MAEASPTRINVDGLVAILAIAGMAWIAVLAGGYYILVVAVIAIVYGAGVLASSDDRPIMTSLHVAFFITLLSFSVFRSSRGSPGPSRFCLRCSRTPCSSLP